MSKQITDKKANVVFRIAYKSHNADFRTGKYRRSLESAGAIQKE
jgi:hypothetical protein